MRARIHLGLAAQATPRHDHRGTLVAPMRWGICFVAVMMPVGAVACGANVWGNGTGTGATPGGGDDDVGSSTGLETDTSAAEDGGGGGTGGDPLDATTTTSDPAASDGANTTGPPARGCDSPPLHVVTVNVGDALLDPDMHLDSLGSIGEYAYSEQTNAGRASFQFMVPCADEYWVWALVHDPEVGVSGLDYTDPDSYRVAFDDDPEIDWWYGCETWDADWIGSTWEILRVSNNGDTQCFSEGTDFRRLLDPGVHLVHLTNREPGQHQPFGQEIGRVAAVRQVILTNDPTFVP